MEEKRIAIPGLRRIFPSLTSAECVSEGEADMWRMQDELVAVKKRRYRSIDDPWEVENEVTQNFVPGH